jgi:hypothetical protein
MIRDYHKSQDLLPSMAIGANIPIKKDSTDLWRRIKIRYSCSKYRPIQANAHSRKCIRTNSSRSRDNLTHTQCEPGSRMGDSGKALNLLVFVNTPITVYVLINKVYASAAQD